MQKIKSFIYYVSIFTIQTCSDSERFRIFYISLPYVFHHIQCDHWNIKELQIIILLQQVICGHVTNTIGNALIFLPGCFHRATSRYSSTISFTKPNRMKHKHVPTNELPKVVTMCGYPLVWMPLGKSDNPFSGTLLKIRH